MSVNARLREQREANERANREESMRRLAELFESVQRREDEQAARDAELRAQHGYSKNYQPDETDDQWANDWQKDFEESERDYEQLGGYR